MNKTNQIVSGDVGASLIASGKKPISSVLSICKSMNWRGGIAVLIFFFIWYLMVYFEALGFKQIPGPIEVMQVVWRDYLFNASYWESWYVSFQRVAIGFILAQIFGIPLGLALGTSTKFNHIVYPVFEILRPIPPLAWVPLSILFWPTNELSIVFITFIGAFFIIVLNVYEGVHTIKKEYFWLARSVGAKKRHIFYKIIIPAVIPSIAVGMTLGIAVTWNVVIAAEMIASDSGLGRLTWEGYVSGTPSVVLVGMISIGFAGYLSTLVITYIEKRMMPWR